MVAGRTFSNETMSFVPQRSYIAIVVMNLTLCQRKVGLRKLTKEATGLLDK